MGKGMYFNSPVGRLWIEEEENKIIQISGLALNKVECPTVFLKMVCRELSEYFQGRRKEFTFPIALRGTAFQLRVWQALREIPYGKTKSYKEIANEIGSPNSYRAVGGACNKNPILLAIPCHRVLGNTQSLTGFGLGLNAKEALLRLEGCRYNKN